MLYPKPPFDVFLAGGVVDESNKNKKGWDVCLV